MSEIFRAFENWRAHCVQEGGFPQTVQHIFLGPKEMVLTDICILPYSQLFTEKNMQFESSLCIRCHFSTSTLTNATFTLLSCCLLSGVEQFILLYCVVPPYSTTFLTFNEHNASQHGYKLLQLYKAFGVSLLLMFTTCHLTNYVVCVAHLTNQPNQACICDFLHLCNTKPKCSQMFSITEQLKSCFSLGRTSSSNVALLENLRKARYNKKPAVITIFSQYFST